MSFASDNPPAVSRKAARVAGAYLVFAALWIFASDRLLILALNDPELLTRISMAKGFAFVAVTTLLLYLLLRLWDAPGAESGAMPLPAPRLRKLAALFLGLLLIVPLIAFSIVHLHGPHLRNDALTGLSAVASLKANQIESWLAERRGDAEVLADAKGLAVEAERWVLTGNPAARTFVAHRLETFRKAKGFDSARLLDASGQTVLAVGADVDAHALVKQQLLPAALASGEVQRSELYRDAAGHVHLDYVVPLPGSAGNPRKITALVVLHAPVERFLFPLIQTWPTPSRSAETLLARRDGDKVLFLNELRHRSGAALSLSLPLDDTAKPVVAAVLGGGKALSMEGYDYRGVAVFAATRPVAGTTWQLVAKIDREEVLAPLDLLTFWVSLVAFVAVSAIATIMLLLWRQTLHAHRLELDAQATAMLRESEAKYRRLHESMRDAFAMTDMSGRLIDFNQAFCEMTGYSAEELQNLTYVDLTPKKWHEAEARILNEQVLVHGQSPVYEKEYLRKDGTAFPVELKTFLICDENGQPEAMWAIVRDITQRKKIEEEISQLNASLEKKVEERTAQLRAINQELETFTYSVSHDLKAPLRGIDGYSQLLQENHAAGLNPEAQTFIANIRHGAQQMNQLIEDLLAYSRLERRPLQTARIAPGSAADAVVAEFAEEIQARQIAASVAIPCLEVSADADGLAMILRNLLDNALKFTRDVPQPAIEIGGREETESCIVWVRDNGIGFDMKFHERIFEIFQRLQRNEDYPGTGIGLAIARKAAQRMGGRVWAESSPGTGATFYVELPK